MSSRDRCFTLPAPGQLTLAGCSPHFGMSPENNPAENQLPSMASTYASGGTFTALLILSVLAASNAPAANRDWPAYLGDKARTHFSPLDQINPRNIDRLEVAWTYHAGDARVDNLSQIQCNPLVIDGVLYGTTPQLKLVALQAATGRELWRLIHSPAAAKEGSWA